MKYVALLRGINVGGKGKVSMTELKKVFEDFGFGAVSTYINSGNVLFISEKTNTETLSDEIERLLEKTFHFPIRVMIRSREELKEAVQQVPSEWKKHHDIRCYIAFVKKPVTPADVVSAIKINEAVDSMKIGREEVYMTTKLSGLTKSGFTKLTQTPVYKDITIRNFNTTQKLLALLEK